MWNTIKRCKRIAQQEADKLWRENHRKELRKNSKELDKFMIFIAPVILLIILILLIAKTKSVFGIIFFVFICIITVLLTLKFRYPSVFNKLIAFRYRGKQITVIRCKTCKGTGKLEQEINTGNPKYTTSGISGMFIGYETIKGIANCPNCGGSGCKWIEVNNAK